MPRKPFFKAGELCGRHKVVEASAHGKKIQRYRAHDPVVDQRVLITCAKADRKQWTARFEELARKRAQIPSTPCVLDWGVTPNGVFYIVEEDLEGQSLESLVGLAREGAARNPLMASAMVCFAYLCGLADTLSRFAELGFWHGAFHPSATLKLPGRGTALTGIGFLQILGCTQGPELRKGKYLAPEARAGMDFDERADVFGICSFVWDLMRGNESDAEALRQLDDLAEPFVWGMKADPAERPRWEELRLLVFRLLGQLALASGGQTDRLIDALIPESTNQPTDAPKTQPRTPRTDAVVRQEYAQTLRELSADQMGASVEVEKEWVWKEYPRTRILRPAKPEGHAHRCGDFEILSGDDYPYLQCALARHIVSGEEAEIRYVSPAIAALTQKSPEHFYQSLRKRKDLRASGIPRLIVADIAGDETRYLIEAAPEGRQIAVWVRRHESHDTEASLNAIQAIGRVFAECAKVGLFHGDIIPERDLWLDTEGKPQIRGIGALQITGLDRLPSHNDHAAPERRYGEPFDQRADIFSLGSVLCELTRGILLPTGDPSRADHDRRGAELLLERALERATAKSAGERFATWEEFLEAIAECVEAYEERKAQKEAKAKAPMKKPVPAPKTRKPAQPEAPSTPRISVHLVPSSEEITPPPHARGRALPMSTRDIITKAAPSLKPPIPAQSTRPMESSESEPITLRSIPFRHGRAYRTWAPLGIVAVMAAFVAFVGLHWLRRSESRELAALQWPVIPKAFVDEAARPVEQPAPRVERTAEPAPTAQKRRAQKKRWSLCDVAACPPDGRPLRD